MLSFNTHTHTREKNNLFRKNNNSVWNYMHVSSRPRRQKRKKKKDGIQYISFNVKNTSAQKTDLRWEAMANICSVCSYGLFSGIAAVIRPQTAEYKNVTSMNFHKDVTQHVCNVSWRTHMKMYTLVWCKSHEHRTGPAWMSKLLESESLQRSFLFRQVWKFLFVQLQSVLLFSGFVL